jgi:hypothetical protein
LPWFLGLLEYLEALIPDLPLGLWVSWGIVFFFAGIGLLKTKKIQMK